MFEKVYKNITVLISIIIVITSSGYYSFYTTSSLNNIDQTDSNITLNSPSYDDTDSTNLIYFPLVLGNFPKKNIMGAQLKGINDNNGLQLMLDANSAWTRLDYRWSLVQPSEGPIEWGNASKLDEHLINADSVGMEVLLILGDAPVWARFPEWPCGGKINPDKYEFFEVFIYEFVKRYSNPPFNIKYFEMWNEPEAAGALGCWGDPSDGAYYGGKAYGEMLKVAYPAAKAANPNAEILVGGLLLDCDPTLGLTNSDGSIKNCVPSYFLKGILEVGAGDSFDGVAFHAYDYYGGELGTYGNSNFNGAWNTTGPVTLEKSRFVRSILHDYGYSDKYLMNTEAGLICNGCDPTDKVLQITKAYYVAQEFATALADGYVANVWYSVYGDLNNSVYGDRNNGLITLDNQPYPAYYAFSFVSHALENHDFVRKLTLENGVMGFEFKSKSGKIQWVLWSIDGQEHNIMLDSLPFSVYRIAESGDGENYYDSEELVTSTEITIGVAPMFIKF